MKRRILVLLLIVTVTAIVSGGWLFFHHAERAAEESEEEVTPVASVETAPIVRKTFAATTSVYGSVIAQAGKTHTITAGFEARILHVFVEPGQHVRKGDAVLEIAASPAASLAVNQAKTALETSLKDLHQTQQRFNLKLATNQELGQAQKAVQDAESQLQSLRQAGAGGQLFAETDGVVASIAIENGQLAATGSPLAGIVADDDIEVKIGVEPEDALKLVEGQRLAIFKVNGDSGKSFEGTVRLIAHRIDPATRLVDVHVALPPASGLMLNGYVRAEIEQSASDALVVPRSAVLPDGEAFIVFTISDGRAVKHTVQTGIETRDEIQIVTPDLHESDAVVVVGNYELENGMKVEAM
ncbi:MAG TPA: efflux RND transporter periplasmic adaptor subunit [Chthoniobacterales bacterium]